TVIGNAGIVLADRVIEHGWIAVADGRIAEIGEGKAPAGSEDARGDLLMPGLIELHTDHLEAHYVPRPKVYWDPIAAVVSYDGQLVTCGITTVLDSLRVWREDGAEDVDGRAGVLAKAITAAREENILRADHFLHLRCEVPMPDVVEEAKELVDRPDVRLMNQFLGFLDHVRHRHLAAQMQEVIGAQDIGFARVRNRLRQHAGAAVDIFGAVLAPNPQRIQHRGYSAGYQLPVIG